MYYIDPAQHLITAGLDLDDLSTFEEGSVPHRSCSTPDNGKLDLDYVSTFGEDLYYNGRLNI